MADTEENVEVEDDFLASSRGPTHAWHQQETGNPFVVYPPRPSTPSAQYYRQALSTDDNYEINPRAELVTNVGGGNNGLGASLHSHPSYAEPVDRSIIDVDAGTLRSIISIPPSSSQVHVDDGFLRAHSPKQETDELGEQYEEFVPTNGELDPGLRRFRARTIHGESVSAQATSDDNEARPELGDPEAVDTEQPSIVLGNMDLATYDGRLETYSLLDWRHDFMSAEVLAEAGFYYTGDGDAARCFGCGEVLRDWAAGDDPREQHLLHFDSRCF